MKCNVTAIAPTDEDTAAGIEEITQIKVDHQSGAWLFVTVIVSKAGEIVFSGNPTDARRTRSRTAPVSAAISLDEARGRYLSLMERRQAVEKAQPQAQAIA